jgi:Kef-type K+ transport system membrane component KefB/nucleotide-binding universal stress UspA family protein
MLLLLSGMETDLRLVRRIGRPAFVVSIAGIAVPFVLGVIVGETIPAELLPNPTQRLVTALFLGTTLSISSVKIVAMVIREMDFTRRNIGQILLSAAILDDSIAWILLGIISSLAVSGVVDVESLLRSVFGTVAFLVLAFAVGRELVFRMIRFTNDTFVSEAAVVSTILALMGALALATDAIGVHTVLGAFVAGMLVGNSPILTRQIDDQLRGLVTSLFMPVFFGLSGLRADLRVLGDPTILLLTIGMIVLASFGKFGGAYLGGYLAGLSWRECLTLACGMNARGSTEVIVATVGLSVGVLDQKFFTMIVTMALITTLAMPPMLRWALSRLPFTEDEKERLRRETFAEKSFVGGLERLLIAVDESATGIFAARIAGLMAGSRGLPTTVLHLNPTRSPGPAATAETPTAAPDEHVRSAAEDSKTAEALKRGADGGGDAPDAVPLTLRVQDAPLGDAIKSEAAKGYDLLVLGIEGAIYRDGRISRNVSAAADQFAGPLAVVDARGIHRQEPLDRRLRILVPFSGTDNSRRALELAASLARAAGGRVTALSVATRETSESAARGFLRFRARETQELVLREAVSVAGEYDVSIRTAMTRSRAPEESILRYLGRARYDLVVMGVRRRPGERLYFGEMAEAILARSEQSLLLIAS